MRDPSVLLASGGKKMSYRPLEAQESSNAPGGSPNINSGNGRNFRTFRDPLGPLIDWILTIMRNKSKIVGYLAGGLFAIGWWIFLDGITIASKLGGMGACSIETRDNCYIVPNIKLCKNSACLVESPKFEDWLPGIFSTFALIILNLVDKESLNGVDDFGSNNVAIKSRAIAFIGATIGLGAIGGALTTTIIKTVLAKNISG